MLGSLPGDRSIVEGRYYAHPTNQFWRLMGALLGTDLHGAAYDDRLAVLAAHRVGLWDVFDAAHRRGSADSTIREALANPVAVLRDRFPSVEAIGFNGAAAAAEGRRHFDEGAGLALFDLPSSSAANTMPFAAKLSAWSAMRPYLDPLRPR